MNSLGEADDDRKQPTTRRQEESGDDSSQHFHSDEKKENNFRNANPLPTSTSIKMGSEKGRLKNNTSVLSDFSATESPATSIGTSQCDDETETSPPHASAHRQIDVETVGIPTGSGLHHRHNNHGPSSATSSVSQTTGPPSTGIHMVPSTSPNRRRRARAAMGKGVAAQKRKWTVMQIFRSLLMAGVSLYVFFVFRGTQMLMQHHDENTEDSLDSGEPSTMNRFSDYIHLPHPAMVGYLRSASSPMSIESMGLPFVQKPMRENITVINEMLKQRRKDRRGRTRPPIQQQQPSIIQAYDIVSSNDRGTERGLLRQPNNYQGSPILANVTQLCGEQALKARANNPGAFLQKDVLRNSDAKVLITGIVSNPLAFHLALALKAQCGVEVLIGFDPMVPNTIRNRLRFVEQLKILASNVPKMVQPVLVPLLGLDPRVKKTKKGETPDDPLMLETTGEINLINFQPTHIVHLSASTYQNPISRDFVRDPLAPKLPLSPYQVSEDDPYEPSLFHIRSSLTAMEQILASAVSSTENSESDAAPHVTYASATLNKAGVSSSSDDTVLHYSKLADEVLAGTYNSLFGTSSVGVRFPPNAIYGPWGQQDSNLYKLFDGAIVGNYSSFTNHDHEQHFIYVQDAVEAIITAMQYRTNEASTFELAADSAATLSTVASMAHSLMTEKPAETPRLALPQRSRTQALEWEPRTSLRDGVLKTLAWHMDKMNPYGPPLKISEKSISSSQPPNTGDALLQRHSVGTCDANHLACHTGMSFLPCSSECSVKAQCQPSIFDSVRDLTRDMTEGCDAVLYTQSLAPDVEDLQLQSQFEDDVEPAICNLAYVSQSSPLVTAVIEKIPDAELVRLGVSASATEEEKRIQLNGRLLYRGWILIWVGSSDSVSPADASLLKLSPGRMFARDVMYAVFVEENFTVSPTMDDVRFLISQMDRGATKQRNVYRTMKKDEQSKPAKVRLVIKAQPEKRAAILVSQLKFKISERGRIPQDTKISIMDAVRFMRFEIGSDPTKQKESLAIRRQKDFYRRIPTFINGKDLRDNDEALYKYDINHWVRTRWVVHDLTLEESRGLRCDWYQEHVQWGSEVDQLSFAAAMADRIINRRMQLREPDDRVKKSKDDIAELKELTDTNEWFPIASERTKIDLSAELDKEVEIHEADAEEVRDAEDEGADEGLDVSADHSYSPKKKPDVGLYVRVISDRIMSLSRKAWARYRAEMLQANRKPPG